MMTIAAKQHAYVNGGNIKLQLQTITSARVVMKHTNSHSFSAARLASSLLMNTRLPSSTMPPYRGMSFASLDCDDDLASCNNV